MGATNFDAVAATTLTGNLTGDVTGNLNGNASSANSSANASALAGFQTLGSATAYTGADAPTLAISPAAGRASMTKGSAGAYTLAAPGAGNVGKVLVIECGSAYAHVVTVTGLAGGNTLTFTNVVGAAATLYAVSATVWGIIGLGGAALSTV